MANSVHGLTAAPGPAAAGRGSGTSACRQRRARTAVRSRHRTYADSTCPHTDLWYSRTRTKGIAVGHHPQCGSKGMSVSAAGLVRPTNCPKPRVPDEGAVADDGAAADEDGADRAGELEALVGRVVARVVEVGGAQRAPRRRVEQDEVGVAAGLDRALALEPEQAGRRRRQRRRPSARRSAGPSRRPRSRRSPAASRCPARRCRSGRTGRRAPPRPSRRPSGRGRGRWR